MPRKAKAVMPAEAPTALSGQAILKELERKLDDKLKLLKAIEIECRQLKEAIAEARKARERKRSEAFGDLVKGDKSDAGRALRAALIERMVTPEHRELFDLPPLERNIIGNPGAEVTTGVIASDHSAHAAPNGIILDRSEGQDRGDGAPSNPIDPKGVSDTIGGGDDEVGSPVDQDGMGGSAEADKDADEAAVSTSRSNLPDGIPGRKPEDDPALRPVQSDEPLATRVAPADGVEAQFDGAAEDTSAASPHSRTEPAGHAQASPDLDLDPFAPSPPSFISRAFISTRETANGIKARGFKLQKGDGGIWTVTATTAAELELLAPLGLKPYNPGRS
jgi:hypothetical protein